MATNVSASSADNIVDFNRINLALARRQGLLATLMGVGSADKPMHESMAEVASDEQDGFTADPELLGIGGKIQNIEEVSRQRLFSNNQLKRQLLGRDFEKKQSTDRKSSQDIMIPGTAVNRKAALQQPLRRIEMDSDDNAGRSSLGKSKRKRMPLAEERAAMEEKAKKGDKEPPLSDDAGLPQDAITPIQQKHKTTADIVSARRTSKKRKKKSRKKQQEVEEGNSFGLGLQDE